MPIATAQPTTDISSKLIVLYGPPKFGKSTFASQIPNATFLATERGLDNLETTRWENDDGRYVIQSWNELLAATDEAIKAGSKTVIIDTLGNACSLAEKHVCDKYSEGYISDGKLGYGKGTRLVVNEIKRYLNKLGSIGIGVVLIAHASSKTVTTRTGEITKHIPMIPGDNKREELYNSILASADLIAFTDQERVQRENGMEVVPVLRLRPDPTFEAGDRSGRLPAMLPLRWKALCTAYAAGSEKTASGAQSKESIDKTATKAANKTAQNPSKTNPKKTSASA